MQTYTNNGFTGKLTLSNELTIYDRQGRCVLHTDSANVKGTRSKWLKRQVDNFPEFMRILGREDLLC